MQNEKERKALVHVLESTCTNYTSGDKFLFFRSATKIGGGGTICEASWF